MRLKPLLLIPILLVASGPLWAAQDGLASADPNLSDSAQGSASGPMGQAFETFRGLAGKIASESATYAQVGGYDNDGKRGIVGVKLTPGGHVRKGTLPRLKESINGPRDYKLLLKQRTIDEVTREDGDVAASETKRFSELKERLLEANAPAVCATDSRWQVQLPNSSACKHPSTARQNTQPDIHQGAQ